MRTYHRRVALPTRKARPLSAWSGRGRLRWTSAWVEHERRRQPAVVVQTAKADGAKLIVLLPMAVFLANSRVPRRLVQEWVARCVQQAVWQGWKHDQRGPDMRLPLSRLLPAQATARELAQQITPGQI
ncbi:hypothetical protein Lfu02_76010 [Longispora fulva]|nr:hypothetical protein Lfu02_76010 [Longispora fulva]